MKTSNLNLEIDLETDIESHFIPLKNNSEQS